MAVTLIKTLSTPDDELRASGKHRYLYGCASSADIASLPTTCADYSLAYVNGGTDQVFIAGSWGDV